MTGCCGVSCLTESLKWFVATVPVGGNSGAFGSPAQPLARPQPEGLAGMEDSFQGGSFAPLGWQEASNPLPVSPRGTAPVSSPCGAWLPWEHRLQGPKPMYLP